MHPRSFIAKIGEKLKWDDLGCLGMGKRERGRLGRRGERGKVEAGVIAGGVAMAREAVRGSEEVICALCAWSFCQIIIVCLVQPKDVSQPDIQPGHLHSIAGWMGRHQARLTQK